MKQPKKLLRRQKEWLSRRKINAENYMLVTETDTEFRLWNKTEQKVEIFEK